jgi:RNA polymerase sigma factor (sigma-70 family)
MSHPSPASRSQSHNDLIALFRLGRVAELADADLIAAYLAGGPNAEPAFSALVCRHGPTILGTCRRILGPGDDHDVADAFQAIFLVLARRAGSLSVTDTLSPWLHAVAVRVARHARARRRALRARVHAFDDGFEPCTPSNDPGEQIEQSELRLVIDEELERLPRRYRDPIVLCDLEGLPRDLAAARLRCPLGTLDSRLHRGRARLRSRLLRRGMNPTLAAVMPHLAAPAAQAVPKSLATRAVQAAIVRLGEGSLAPAVTSLALAAVRSALLMRLTWIAAFAALPAAAALAVATLVAIAQDPPKSQPTASSGPPAPIEQVSSIADQFEAIKAAFDADHIRAERADAAPIADPRPGEPLPHAYVAVTDYARRAVDLAIGNPTDPAAREALLWVINMDINRGEGDREDFGVQFLRALRELVHQHSADLDLDLELARAGLRFRTLVSRYHDAYFEYALQAIQGHEAEGLIRIGAADYLAQKARDAYVARSCIDRIGCIHVFSDQEWNPAMRWHFYSAEEKGRRMHLRLCDPIAMRAEAERLYHEVIEDYADIPYQDSVTQQIQAALQQGHPEYRGRPLTDANRLFFEKKIASPDMLGDHARGYLEVLLNDQSREPALSLLETQPDIDEALIDIDGPTLDGHVMKLSGLRGKVVVLDFWFAACGACIDEVPARRKLAETYADRPFAIVGVNVGDPASEALKAAADAGMTWPSWSDPSRDIARRFSVEGGAATLVIDALGRIRALKKPGESLGLLVERLVHEAESGTVPHATPDSAPPEPAGDPNP